MFEQKKESEKGWIPVAQHAVDVASVVVGDEETARSAVDVAELLAGQAHGGRVHDRHHLLDVLRQDSIEQSLVAVLREFPSRFWFGVEFFFSKDSSWTLWHRLRSIA